MKSDAIVRTEGTRQWSRDLKFEYFNSSSLSIRFLFDNFLVLQIVSIADQATSGIPEDFLIVQSTFNGTCYFNLLVKIKGLPNKNAIIGKDDTLPKLLLSRVC